MRLNEDPPEEIGTPEAGWDGMARRTQRPQGERAERFELPEPVPGTFSAAAGDREDMPEGQRDAGTAPVEQLYPTAKMKPEPFTVPSGKLGRRACPVRAGSAVRAVGGVCVFCAQRRRAFSGGLEG